MEVEYELTPEDLYAYQWRAVNTSPLGRRAKRKMYLYLLLAVVLLAVVPAIGPGGFDFSQISFGFIVIAFAVVASLTWFLEKRMTRRLIRDFLKEEKPDKGQLGKHRLVLDETGLLETTAVGESRTSWAGVHRVEQNPDYIFIYIAPAAAHVVPRRAFASTTAADTFYERVKASVEAAA